MTGPLLTFNILKKFPKFSLECQGAFERGVTAIFGPSGSGKTTLLNCIAGIETPDQGEIETMGQTMFSSSGGRNVPPERRRFGYVFQDSALFPHMSVRDNLMYGYKLTPPQRRETEPDHLVELLQLSQLLDRSVTNLSGGERQRVALARALATSPRLLLLDEPLASLDAVFRGTIMKHLKRVSRELGTPMVYVSHSISEIMALADNTLVLSKGRPVMYGRTTQVLVHPGVAQLADYSTLENLLQATVVSSQPEEDTSLLRVGNATLISPQVSMRSGEVVMISIRAGDIILALDVPPRISARNVIEAVIEKIHTIGPRILVYVDLGSRIAVEITTSALRDLELREGQRVHLIVKTNSIMVIDAPSGGGTSDR